MSYFERVYTGQTKSIGKVLSVVYPELPYALLMRLLRNKDVFVNAARVKENATVSSGSTLDLFCAPAKLALRVVYSDDNLLALYKPKGVSSDGPCSFEGLASYAFGPVTLLHRLDTNTDGILLFARNDVAYEVLRRGMQSHEIIKTYMARVYGKMPLTPCVLTGYLRKDKVAGRVTVTDRPLPGAAAVQCKVRPLSYDGNTTYVELELCGGKTHQLRAQLAHCGHFILGDGKYGDDKINRRYDAKKQLLTATKIQFAFDNDVLGLNRIVISLD